MNNSKTYKSKMVAEVMVSDNIKGARAAARLSVNSIESDFGCDALCFVSDSPDNESDPSVGFAQNARLDTNDNHAVAFYGNVVARLCAFLILQLGPEGAHNLVMNGFFSGMRGADEAIEHVQEHNP